MISIWTLLVALIVIEVPQGLPWSTNANQSTGDVLATGRLIFAHVIYRHGDRMPLYLCPTDPWNKLEYWPNEWGELSNLGVQQHYALGQWLRVRYHTLLSPVYTPSEIYIRSTDEDRSIMSAQANLAGLYAPQDDKLWNTAIRWQPVAVHTEPLKTDYLMGKADCSQHQKALAEFMLTDEVQALHQRSQHMYDYYTKHCGRTVNTLQELQYMYGKFYIEELYNKTLPDWARPIYGSDELEYIHQWVFAIKTQTRQMARLKGGPLVKDMLERMRDKVNATLKPDRSMWIYSGHDTTIAHVLNSLNMFQLHRPGYASALMVELRLDGDGQPFVSIFYRNTTNSQPLVMEIPNCGVACPLEQMFELYADILPDDIAAECNARQGNSDMIRISNVLFAFLGILVVVVLMLCVMTYQKRRPYFRYNGTL